MISLKYKLIIFVCIHLFYFTIELSLYFLTLQYILLIFNNIISKPHLTFIKRIIYTPNNTIKIT